MQKEISVALSSRLSIAYSEGITNTHSVLFDGIDDWVDCGNSATLNPADITIVAWIKPAALTSWDYLVLRGIDDYDKAYRFEVGATQLFCAFGDGGTENVSIIATHGMSNSNWYHVAVTFDGSNAALYVDGASIGTASISIVMDTDVQTTYICNSVGTQPHFDGRVDEVAIFSSALSAGDILAIYNNGTPGDLIGYSPAAWWRMGDSNDSSTTLIYDEVDKSIGDELLTNGSFDGNSSTSWALGTGWSISSNRANQSGSIDYLTNTSFAPTIGKTYKVEYEVTTYTSGTSYFMFGHVGVSANLTAEAVGVYTYYIQVTSLAGIGGKFTIYPSSFIGSIDNVSVKQIGGNPGILTNGASFSTDIP